MKNEKQGAKKRVRKPVGKDPHTLWAKVLAKDAIEAARIAGLEPRKEAGLTRESYQLSARQVVYADRKIGAKRTSYYLATAMPNAAGEETYTRARIRAYQYKELTAALKGKIETCKVVYKDAEWPRVKVTAHFGAKDKTAVVVVQAEDERLKEYARESAFGKALELWRITEPQLASEKATPSREVTKKTSKEATEKKKEHKAYANNK